MTRGAATTVPGVIPVVMTGLGRIDTLARHHIDIERRQIRRWRYGSKQSHAFITVCNTILPKRSHSTLRKMPCAI